MSGRDPQRSCLGCGTVRVKEDLLRFVLAPDRTLVPDCKGKLPGRGAYTCPERPCVEAALKRSQFNRSFKGEVKAPPAADLTAAIRTHAEDRIGGYLALANKAGKIVSGSDMVVAELRKSERIGLVFVGTDISADIREKVAFLAARRSVPLLALFDKDRMGALLGKGLRSVVAVEQGGFVHSIIKEYTKYRNFFDGGLD